jgi:HEAT repeat protein
MLKNQHMAHPFDRSASAKPPVPRAYIKEGLVALRTGILLLGLALAPSPFGAHLVPSVDSLREQVARVEAAPDVRDLLAAVRGAPPLLCGLASGGVASGAGGYGWGWDAPSPPIGADVMTQLDRFSRRGLTSTELRVLTDGLDEQDPCVREISARILGRTRDSATVDALFVRLSSRRAPTRAAAALALGLARPPRALGPLLRVLGDSAAAVRSNGAWALGRVKDDRAVGPLTHTLDDTQPVVRRAAVVALGRIRADDPVRVLTGVLRNDASAQVRKAAAWALAQIGDHAATGAQTSALQHDDSATVREMAAWAIGHMNSGAGAHALASSARGRSTNTSQLAYAETTTQALAAAVQHDQSADVRSTSAWALGRIRPERAPRGLVAALADASQDVRLDVAWALGRIRDSTTVSALETAVRREHDDQVRRAEFRALLMAGEHSESAIESALQSSDAEIREMAAMALAGRGRAAWPWPRPKPRPFP